MDISFEDQCRLGERADGLLRTGHLDAADHAYRDLAVQVAAGKSIDAFIAAKLTLGLLLTRVRSGDLVGAQALWLSREPGAVFSAGIFALENGQTSAHDLALYRLISAHLHSLKTDPALALEGVNQELSQVASYGFDRDRRMVWLVLRNWKQHLSAIYSGGPYPEGAARSLLAIERRFGQSVPLGPIDFPPPARWAIDWLPVGGVHSPVRAQGSGPNKRSIIFG
jgi:hypothetical protein